MKPDPMEIVKEIQKICEQCVKFSRKPLSFQVGAIDTDSLVFNKEISLDIFWINKKKVLHVIELATRYSAAVLLTD